MAQRQRDGRFLLVVLRRGQHFGEAHHLAVFVGYLDTYRGLARDDLDHSHTGHGQRARQVLGQVGDTADLHAGGRLDFVTGNYRAGVDRVHRHFHTEFLELDFQQLTDASQGLWRILDLFLFGRVEDGNRGQGAFHGAVDEQRRLLFLHRPLARLRRLGG
ncbi:hypothetical protein D9M73_218410 [compost metagenome]